MLNLCRSLKRAMQHRIQQARGLGVRGKEMRLQLVAQGHQLIYLGDDAVLFGEGRLWNLVSLNCCDVNSGRCASRCLLFRNSRYEGGIQDHLKECRIS